MNRKLLAVSLFVGCAVPCLAQERAPQPAALPDEPVSRPAVHPASQPAVRSAVRSEVRSEVPSEVRPASPSATPGTQNATRKSRPRIGVALEGGGALGIAHIGVLQWFEQHHIPVDYIAGTSMGSLVAGLYATGQSPASIEQLVTGIDWPFVIGGWTP